MGYQSKTYSLSDEVIAAIEEARSVRGLTPNQFLRRALGLEPRDSSLVANSPVPLPTGISKLPDTDDSVS